MIFNTVSGHGDRCRSDPSTGKESRVVKTGPEERVPGDYELNNTGVSRRKATQIVSIEELLYYNEVLITRVVEQRDDEEEEDKCAVVRDNVCDNIESLKIIAGDAKRVLDPGIERIPINAS
ncbi:hypothetical protein OPQ81_009063 [Rhizoctonia solani]|nr:hypothetical protein OPQ81_009063 [Rhizoctonia solani]